MLRHSKARNTRMRRYLLAFLLSFLPAMADAQTNPAAQAARIWRQQHERAIVDEFITLLSIPNIASDRENIQRNATAIAAMMEKRGIRGKTGVRPGRQSGRVRRNPHAGRDANRRLLRPLRRPAARPQGMDVSTVRADAARQAGGGWRTGDRGSAGGRTIRSRVETVRSWSGRRQGADRRAHDRNRRHACRRRRVQEPTSSLRSKARKRAARRISKKPWPPTKTSSQRISG